MSLSTTIRLVLPHEGDGRAMDTTHETGGGFRTVTVEYAVNPVGSKHLYRLVKVLRKGVEVDLGAVERLNPADCVDEAISAKFKDYAKEVQRQPVAKRVKKTKAEPPKDEGQFTMEIPDL